MNLGEKITSLRTARRLSQGDLAERLNVSRQSVSKWETGASVPELDKLIQLCDLFQITMDALVRSEAVPERSQPETPVAYVAQSKPNRVQCAVGYLLLAAGLLGMILGLIQSRTLILAGICCILYGAILLALRKHAWLVCGCLTVAFFVLLLVLTHSGYMLLGWGSLLLIVTTVIITIVLLRKREK